MLNKQLNRILNTKSKYQTNEWLDIQTWGSSDKIDVYKKTQIKIFENITKLKITASYDRIHTYFKNLQTIKMFVKSNNDYNWTDKFDYSTFNNKNNIYINFRYYSGNKHDNKIDKLLNMYTFIQNQAEHKLINQNKILFINILDGDTSYYNIDKFKFLLNQEKFNNIKSDIFIGSLYDFQYSKMLNKKIL